MKLGEVVTGRTPKGEEHTGKVVAVNLNTAVIEVANRERKLIMLKEAIKQDKAEKPVLLAEARKEKGLLQADVAGQAGVTQSLLSMHERGKAYPSDEHLERYAQILKVRLVDMKAERDRLMPKPKEKTRFDVVPENAHAFKAMAKEDHVKMHENDPVNHPNHYQGLNGLEARDVHENFVPKYAKYGGMVMCDMKDVVKYVLRAPDKNGVEDLKKAKQHLDWAIKALEVQHEGD